MPTIGLPRGTQAPDVAAMAGMPIEAAEGAVAPAISGLVDTFKGAWQNIRPQLRGLSNILGEGPIQGLQSIGSDIGSVIRGNGLMPDTESYATGYLSQRPPKPGGVLHQVLERGGELQGAGQDVPPGTQRLMNHFAGIK